MTNPWNEPPRSADPRDAGGRESFGAHHRGHADSVSGTLRISDMVAPRKIPPGSGWRKFIYTISGKTINLGESPGERHYRELRERIRRHIRKQYVIGFVSGKGGVGKTTMTASVGAVFRECRPENVVAIDAAPGFGTLAGRIDEAPPGGDYSAVLNDTDVQGYATSESTWAEPNRTRRAGGQPRLRPAPPPAGACDVQWCAVAAASHPQRDPGGHRRRSRAPRDESGLRCVRHPGVRVGPDRRHLAAGDPVHRSAALARLPRAGVAQHGDPQRQPQQLRLRCAQVSDGAVQPVGRDRRIHALRPASAKGGIIDAQHELQKKTRLRLFEITAALADKYIPDADRPR